jgi:hypothetical protein
LLAAFRFYSTVAPAAPSARINDFGDEFVMAGLQREPAIARGGQANFVGLAVQ